MLIQRYDEQLFDSNYHGEGVMRNFSKSPSTGFFYTPVTKCMYCDDKTILVHESEQHFPKGPGWQNRGPVRTYGNLEVWVCRTCGWWTAKEVDDRQYRDRLDHTTKRYIGMLRIFDSTDKDTPLQVLNDEIAKNPLILKDTHPQKMEELVQCVFASYYACEVKHVGKSHDGGIDLLIIDGDDPIAVQVKRRGIAKPSESVSPVREFLGAMVHKKIGRGIFVSTAPKFTSPAVRLTEDVLRDRQVEQFDLIDFNRFVEIFKTVKVDRSHPWERFSLRGYKSVKVQVENVWDL